MGTTQTEPEVAALLAMAEARAWRIAWTGDDMAGVILSHDTHLELQRGLNDQVWKLQLVFEKKIFPHDANTLQALLTDALLNVAEHLTKPP